MAKANVAAVDEVVEVLRRKDDYAEFSDEGLRRIARWFLDGDVEAIERPRPRLRLVK